MSNPSEDNINCHAFTHTVTVIVNGEYLSVPLSAYIGPPFPLEYRDEDYKADVANNRVEEVQESIGEQQKQDDDNEREKV